MDLVKAMTLAAKGMKAQGTRMKVISENLANAETTGKSKGADPYRRQIVTFSNQVNRADNTKEVTTGKVQYDPAPFVTKYDPSHPAADESGYVKTPNVNPMLEMMDMREAQRSYEANLGVIEMARSMLMKTIELLRAS
ncbi:MAG TPA: flagellar basal body rod protein FlgC [Patescibacteria group bacterium]|nr:flagellar basal body rod protein FlgC [Patescibacteria group bacterium]